MLVALAAYVSGAPQPNPSWPIGPIIGHPGVVAVHAVPQVVVPAHGVIVGPHVVGPHIIGPHVVGPHIIG